MAGPGYDEATGLGTPAVNNLVPDLATNTYIPAVPGLTTDTWIGGLSGDWDVAANWNHGLPGPSSQVVIGTAGATITHSTGTYDTVFSLTVTASNVTLDLSDGTLDLSGGDIDSLGTTLGTFAVDQSGDVVNLSGGVLKDANITAHTVIDALSTGSASVIAGGDLNGTINVQANANLTIGGSWTNSGTITAVSGSTLTLGDEWSTNPSLNPGGFNSDAWVNDGAIITNQTDLYVGGWLTFAGANSLGSITGLSNDTVYLIGTLDNRGTTLALGTQNWYLQGGRILGGKITTSGGGSLIAGLTGGNIDSEGTLDGVELDGNLNMQGAETTVDINDNLTLDVNVTISGGGAGFDFTSDANAPGGPTVTAGVGNAAASITLSGYYYYFNNSDDFLTNDSSLPLTIPQGFTINVSGDGSINGPIDNKGTILADGGSLQINYFPTNIYPAVNNYLSFLLNYNRLLPFSWTNDTTGAISVTNSGGNLGLLQLGMNWTNKGTIEADGGTSLYLGDTWNTSPAEEPTGYDYDVWINEGTITTNFITAAPPTSLYLGGWLTYTPNNLGSLTNLSSDTVSLVGTLDNTGHTLTLTPATTGSLYLDGGRILQGAVLSTGVHTLIATYTAGTLDGVTLDASPDMTPSLDMTEFSGTYVTVLNSLTLNGVIELGGNPPISISDYAELDFGTLDDNVAQTVSGTGSIEFGQFNGVSTYIENQSDATLTFGPQITISAGSDSYIEEAGSATEAFDFKGTITDGSPLIANDQLTINGPGWINDTTGNIGVQNSSTLTLDGSWTNLGTITIDPSTVNFGTAPYTGVGTPPFDYADFGWVPGNVVIAPGSTINLGGVFNPSSIGSLTPYLVAANTINITGTLDLTNAATGTTLTLDAATGPWNLAGGTIYGGTVTSPDGTPLVATMSGGTLDDVLVNCSVSSPAGTTFALAGNWEVGPNGSVNVGQGDDPLSWRYMEHRSRRGSKSQWLQLRYVDQPGHDHHQRCQCLPGRLAHF